jgi:hypothetical protein
MIELAWRFLAYQKDSELAEWYWSRTADRRKDIRQKTNDQTRELLLNAEVPTHPSVAACSVRQGHALRLAAYRGQP